MSSDATAGAKAADSKAADSKAGCDGCCGEEKQSEASADKPSATTSEGKKDSAASDEATTVKGVVERLRFFFSNANIRHDRFMRNLLTKDDGTVSVETLLTFNTIKRLTTDAEVLVKAAKSLSDRIEVTEDSKALKRVKPFTMDQMDDNIPVSLLVENLPTKITEDGKERYAVQMDELRQLFDQYGEVAMVKLRYGKRDNDDDVTPGKQKRSGGGPRGSAMVEFETEAALQAAADDVLTKKNGSTVTPKRKLELGGKELGVMLLKEFLSELKKRKAEAAPEGDSKKEGGGDGKEEKDAEKAPDKKVFTLDWKPGCVIKLISLPGSCDREALLECIGKALDKTVDEVKEKKIYVDYSRGQTEGAIRFADPADGVSDMLAKLQAGDMELCGQKVESGHSHLLSGDEEKEYWEKFIEFKNKQLQQRDDSGGRNYKNKNKHHRNKKRRKS